MARMVKLHRWTIRCMGTIPSERQTFKTAIESATMLLRIDDIVSGSKPKQSAYGEALASGQLAGGQ